MLTQPSNSNGEYMSHIPEQLIKLTLPEKINLSIHVMRAVLERSLKTNTPIFVGFSGGKDSLTLLLLLSKVLKGDVHVRTALEKERLLHIYYIYIPRNTHAGNRYHVEEIISLIDLPARFLVVSRVPIIDTLDFIEALDRWGFPRPRARWCMTEFKKRPLKVALGLLRVDRAYFLLGEKYYDSSKRKKTLGRIIARLTESVKNGEFTRALPCEYNSKWSQLCIYPIIHWSDKDVDYFLKQVVRNIYGIFSRPWCFLYECIGTSGNCLYCIYVTSTSYYTRLAQLPCTRPFAEALAKAELKQRSHFYGVYSKGRTYSIAEIVEKTPVKESPHCKDCPLNT